MPNWSDVVDKYGQLVWRTVRRLVSHEADAADCFQEVFVAAFKISQKDKILSWTATLRHLATVKSIDCLRRRYSVQNSSTKESNIDLVDIREREPDQQLIANELSAALRFALSTLDSQHAEIFCMICLEAMSYQETAEAIGINVNHVGVLLHRARIELQTQLKSYAPSPTNAPTNAPKKGSKPNATHT